MRGFVFGMERKIRGSNNQTINAGDKFMTNFFGEVEVLEYITCNQIKVVFTSTGNTRFVNSGQLRAGKIRDSSTRPNRNVKCSTEGFIVKAVALHGDRYGYSAVDYVDSTLHVLISCTQHGQFLQTPANHLHGHGCIKCRPTTVPKTTEKFVSDAKEVHGDTYSYTDTVYTKAREWVSVSCSTHGSFRQRAYSHLAGRGCPQCNAGCGFKSSKPGHLYVLGSGEVTKVGITNKAVSRRARDISKSAGTEFKVLQVFDLPGEVALEAESATLARLRVDHRSPVEKFDGFSECFYGVDREWLDAVVRNEIEKGLREWKKRQNK